jgi:hypothetical protein
VGESWRLDCSKRTLPALIFGGAQSESHHESIHQAIHFVYDSHYNEQWNHQHYNKFNFHYYHRTATNNFRKRSMVLRACSGIAEFVRSLLRQRCPCLFHILDNHIVACVYIHFNTTNQQNLYSQKESDFNVLFLYMSITLFFLLDCRFLGMECLFGTTVDMV